MACSGAHCEGGHQRSTREGLCRRKGRHKRTQALLSGGNYSRHLFLTAPLEHSGDQCAQVSVSLYLHSSRRVSLCGGLASELKRVSISWTKPAAPGHAASHSGSGSVKTDWRLRDRITFHEMETFHHQKLARTRNFMVWACGLSKSSFAEQNG